MPRGRNANQFLRLWLASYVAGLALTFSGGSGTFRANWRSSASACWSNSSAHNRSCSRRSALHAASINSRQRRANSRFITPLDLDYLNG
jgi:hypothetical protein